MYSDVLPFAGVGFVGLPNSRHSNIHRFGGHKSDAHTTELNKKPLFKQGLLQFNFAQSNGRGGGVFSLEGGKIGNLKSGCLPVNVFRNDTTSSTSCLLN